MKRRGKRGEGQKRWKKKEIKNRNETTKQDYWRPRKRRRRGS